MQLELPAVTGKLWLCEQVVELLLRVVAARMEERALFHQQEHRCHVGIVLVHSALEQWLQHFLDIAQLISRPTDVRKHACVQLRARSMAIDQAFPDEAQLGQLYTRQLQAIAFAETVTTRTGSAS